MNSGKLMTSIVEPIELCLESLDPAEDERPYVRCVALAGGTQGLGLTAVGGIVWCRNESASLLIWVSADNRLMLLRSDEMHRARLTRAERFLELPANKPVVALHGDVIEIEGRSFRVHVHGVAGTVAPPVRLTLRRAQKWVAGAALAAASLAGCRTNAPIVDPPVEPAGNGFAQPPPDGATGGQPATSPSAPPIEVREQPPAPMPRPEE